MLRVNVQIDSTSFKTKPDKKETIDISRRITGKQAEVTIEKLADMVGNKGHTFLPAYLENARNAANFVYQKIFAIDFDGTISVKEFLERAEEYEIRPAFLYETLTCSPDNYKFRAVFVNDITVCEREAAEIIIQLLLRLFPEADAACKDVSRMFFGGKKLIFLDTDNQIDLWNLSLATQAYMKSIEPYNYAKKIKRFANKVNIAIKDNMLCIHRRVYQEMDDFKGNTSIILVNLRESSFFYIIEKTESHPTGMQDVSAKTKYAIEGIDEDTLIERCRLCEDFFKVDLSHEQKFMIATNLLQIKNGENIFFKAPIESVEKWKTAWNYIKKFNYKAEYCNENLCPYYEECKGKTIIEKITSKIQQIQTFEYGEVKDSERLLKKYLKRAISSNDEKIHLIKAQTAIGKTSAYCDLISKTPEKKFMIVLPTNILQDEVAEELENRGVETYVTPNIKLLTTKLGLTDLCEEIEELYNKGYGQKVKPMIQEYLTGENLSFGQREQLEKYLSMKDQFDGKKCIVTTHALFLGLDIELLQKYEIIVDEDILMTIFKNTSSLTLKELDEVLNCVNLNVQCAQRILELINKEDGSVHKFEKIKLKSDEIEYIYKQKLNIQGSLVDFLQADTYHVDLQNERIDFFNVRRLPEVKMTIVSATVIDKLYSAFEKYRTIKLYEVPIAKYRGKLKQYTAHSLSRSNMEQIGMVNLKEAIDNVTMNPEIVPITFKKFSEGRAHYYGNTEGLNIYKGKDIAVIGTPHSIPFIYMLIGEYLGFRTEERLCQRFIEHNGYRFKFMTYGDDNMRMLQFYLIESAVEQTIGRARLLRFDCTVYLFSNFPVRQAEIIQEDYLE